MSITLLQKAVKAPRAFHNSFGGYNYRTLEQMVEAFKAATAQVGVDAYINLSDEVVEIGGRVYVKATATITIEDKQYSSCGYAREQEAKKGMDAAQITGAASSYARKFALAGLLAIDDSAFDPDISNETKQTETETETETGSMPHGRFEAAFPKWEEAIRAKKHTPESIISFIESRGTTLSEAQKKRVRGIK